MMQDILLLQEIMSQVLDNLQGKGQMQEFVSILGMAVITLKAIKMAITTQIQMPIQNDFSLNVKKLIQLSKTLRYTFLYKQISELIQNHSQSQINILKFINKYILTKSFLIMQKSLEPRTARFMKRFEGKIRYVTRETGLIGALFAEANKEGQLRLTNHSMESQFIQASSLRVRNKTQSNTKKGQHKQNKRSFQNISQSIETFKKKIKDSLMETKEHHMPDQYKTLEYDLYNIQEQKQLHLPEIKKKRMSSLTSRNPSKSQNKSDDSLYGIRKSINLRI